MESEGEIEYLDEDAEIVEQLVQAPFAEQASKSKETEVANTPLPRTPLLVERRKSERKRKRRMESDDDSDYDPSQDLEVLSSSSKKRKPTSRKSVTKPSVQLLRSYNKELPVKTYTKTEVVKSVNRKKMDIRIPDYEDPLCLPVKAVRSIGSDVNRLKHWNNACIEHFKHCDTLFKPEKGLTMSSSRTIILKNVVHKETGNTETTVWSKTCVTNGEGVKKSEIFQCLLPKYREKTVLRAFKLNPSKKKPIRHINEVTLTKEEHKNGEVLVVYMPQEKTSAVYKFDEDDKLLSSDNQPDNKPEPRRVLREIASCKMCAPCFQCSWRGSTKPVKRKLQCPICARTTISMYNLLTHVRAHSPNDVRRHKAKISAILAAGDQNVNRVSEENLNETDTKESILDQESTSTPSQQTVDERPSTSQQEVRRSKRISQQKPIQVSERRQHDPTEHQKVKTEIDEEVSERRQHDPTEHKVKTEIDEEVSERRQHDPTEHEKVKTEIDKEVSERRQHDPTEHQKAKTEIDKELSEKRQHDPTEHQKVKTEIDEEIDGVSQCQLDDDDDECNLFGELVAMRLRRFSKDHREQLMSKFLQVVDYHYRCRICNEQVQSIKNLREHVLSHKGTIPFKCEVGNHMTT